MTDSKRRAVKVWPVRTP